MFSFLTDKSNWKIVPKAVITRSYKIIANNLIQVKPKLQNSKGGGRLILNQRSIKPKSWYICEDMMKSQQHPLLETGSGPPMLLLLIGFCFRCLLVLPFRDGVLHADEKQQSPKESHILQGIILYLAKKCKNASGNIVLEIKFLKKVTSLTCVNLMKSWVNSLSSLS